MHKPHGRVQGNAFGVVQILVQQSHTNLTAFAADKHSVVHIVNKVEVSS